MENTGNVTLTDVTIDDPQVTVLGGPLASLAPGATDTTTFSGSYTLTQADVDAGTFTNTAEATGTPPSGPNVTDEDSDTQEYSPSASITLVKTGTLNDDDGIAGVSAGDTISYAFTVENTGSVTLTDVTIDDPQVTVLGGPLASLAAGATDTTTFSGSYTLTQADVDAGTFTNTAEATGTPPSGPSVTDEDSDTQEYSPSASITLVKTGTLNDDDGIAGVSAGDTISYAFTVENTGNVTLTDVTIDDPQVTVLGGPLASLAAGATDTTTFSGSYTLTQADVDAGTFTNTAEATGTPPSGPSVTDEDSDTQEYSPSASIALQKTGTLNDDDGIAGVSAGDTISYAFTVENTGNVTLTDVTIDDPQVTVLGGPLASLAAGATDTTTFSGSYTLTQADVDAGTFTNTAEATGTPPSGPSVTDEDSDTQELLRQPELAIEKSGPTEPVSVDDLISYTITVTNTGNVTLTNVIVNDAKLGVTEALGTLSPGESRTLNPTYTVVLGDYPGPIVNTATADSEETEPVEDTHTVEVNPPNIDLSLVKIVDNLTPNVGDTVVFTLTLANAPNVADATGVVVYDALSSGYSFVSATASQGSYDETTGLWTIGGVPSGTSVTLQITAIVLPINDYINQAEVSAADQTDVDSTPGNGPQVPDEDDDDEVVVTVPLADLAVDKSVDDATPSEGDTIVFTIIVTNNGPSDTTGVVLSDALPAGLTYVSDSGFGAYSAVTNLWTIGNLPVGNSVVLQISATVDSGTLGSTIMNLAEIIATDVEDPDDSNDSDTAEVEIVAADLAVDKSVDNVAPSEGDTVVFTIVVTNNGPNDATNVELTDTLPLGLTYVSDDAAGRFNPTTGIWSIPTLPVLGSETLTITASVDSGTVGLRLTNIAEITASDQYDPDTTNNRDDAEVEVTETVAGGGGSADLCEGKVIINEIAWAGTAADPQDEWIELRNLGSTEVDLTGWVLRWRKKVPVSDEEYVWKTVDLSGALQPATTTACALATEEAAPAIQFVKRDTDEISWMVLRNDALDDASYFTLERRSDDTISNLVADLVYDIAGFGASPYTMELSDAGDVVELLNADGEIVDTANAFEPIVSGWPAGDAATFATMERTDPLGPDVAENWHTNLGITVSGLDASGRPLVATADTAQLRGDRGPRGAVRSVHHHHRAFGRSARGGARSDERRAPKRLAAHPCDQSGGCFGGRRRRIDPHGDGLPLHQPLCG